MENKIYYLISSHKFHLENKPLGILQADFVRVKFLYCGICGGDFSCYLGRRSDYPYTLGHEFVAQVMEVGSNVKNLFIKDFVVSDFNYRCGKCKYCLNGKDHLCIYNNIGYFSNRAFAQYADIHYSYLLSVNNIIPIENATLIEPLSCVIHAYNQIKKICIPNTILIVGLGGIGMLFCFYLKIIKKFKNVFVYDIVSEKVSKVIKIFNCKPLTEPEIIDFDLIIDATNSISGAMFCTNISKSGQKYCMMSHLYGLDTSFIYEAFCQKEIHPIFPLRNGNIGNIKKAINIIKNYWKNEYNITIEVFPISKIQQVFDNKKNFISCKQVFSMIEFQ